MDMAPILILALLLASCDDRGSTPSGGSGVKAIIAVPSSYNFYPSSGSWNAEALPTIDDSEGPATASVEFNPSYEANGSKGPVAIVSGIKSGTYGAVVLGFTSSTGESYQAQVSISGFGTETYGSVSAFGSGAYSTDGKFYNVTPQSVSLTVTPADGLVLTDKASDYSISLTPSTEGKIVSGITPSKVTLTVPPAAAAAASSTSNPTAATLVFSAKGIPADLSNGTSYVPTVTFTSGKAYTVTGSAISIQPGQPSIAEQSFGQLAEAVEGTLTISLPKTFGESTAMSSVKAVDYAITLNGGETPYLSGSANVTASSADDDASYSAKIEGLPAPQTGLEYGVAVSFSYGGVTYSASNTATGPSASSADATLSISSFTAQISSVDVTMAYSPLPAVATQYKASYWIGEKSGSGTEASLSDEKYSWDAKAGTFSIPGLAVGSVVTVEVVITPDLGDKITLTGTTEKLVPGPVELTVLQEGQATVEVSGSVSSITSFAGANVTEKATVALGTANLDSTTKEAGVISANLSLEFTSNSAASVTGSIIVADDTELSGVSSLVFENLEAPVGNATIEKLTIAVSEGDGDLSMSTLTIDTATAVINVTGEITSTNYDNSASLTISSSSELTLTEDGLTITTAPSTASAANVVITLTEAQKGSISGTLTIDTSSAVNMTQLAWSNLNSGSGIQFGGKAIKSVTIKGTYAEGTNTFTLQATDGGLTLSTT